MSKSNRSPISEKAVSREPISYDPSQETSLLDIPMSIKAELKTKGLKAKFINATKLTKNYGIDPRGWRPYKPETKEWDHASIGRDTEGFYRVGDLILAVVTEEQHARMKARLEYKNSLHSGALNQKAAARELREQARESGVRSRISDSYEDEE